MDYEQRRKSCLCSRFIEEKKEEAYTGAASWNSLSPCDGMSGLPTAVNPGQIQTVTALTEWFAKKMEYKEAESVRIQDIWHFLESAIGQRMKTAASNRHLFQGTAFCDCTEYEKYRKRTGMAV